MRTLVYHRVGVGRIIKVREGRDDESSGMDRKATLIGPDGQPTFGIFEHGVAHM